MNNEILDSITNLKIGNTILYPTDTVWGIGCDATNEEAVKKIYQLKQRDESKSLIILVDSLEMLQSIIHDIPDTALKLIKNAKVPTSIIYNNPSNLAKNVIAKDNTVAIRITQDEFCRKLISSFGKAIVSTSANISGTDTPNCFEEIQLEILQNVDYIVNLHQDKKNTKSSQIIMIMEDDSLKTIRK